MGARPKTLEEEIAELHMSDKVEAELAALKAKAAGPAPSPAPSVTPAGDSDKTEG